MIAGQLIQRRIPWQGKAEGIRVVGVVINRREFVGHRQFRFDADHGLMCHRFIIRVRRSVRNGRVSGVWTISYGRSVVNGLRVEYR